MFRKKPVGFCEGGDGGVGGVTMVFLEASAALWAGWKQVVRRVRVRL
jgi:hypothetical protein